MKDAADTLYAASPEDFMALRSGLVQQFKDAGDPAAAKAVGSLRKPTVAAFLVNRLVLDDPSRVDVLLELGSRLRAAHEALDAAVMRELTGERRQLVAELAREAFTLAERRDPPAALRDEVSNTLDAAIADPSIADRLGRLTRSEQWSGFGVAPSGGPGLTLVRGGKGAPSARAAPTARAAPRSEPSKSAPPKAEPETKEPARPARPTPTDTAGAQRARRAVAKAQRAFDDADATLQTAEKAERDTTTHIRSLSDQLSALQQELNAAKVGLTKIRREVKSARVRRREARSALDRAERKATD